jgi:hypothetical protein
MPPPRQTKADLEAENRRLKSENDRLKIRLRMFDGARSRTPDRRGFGPISAENALRALGVVCLVKENELVHELKNEVRLLKDDKRDLVDGGGKIRFAIMEAFRERLKDRTDDAHMTQAQLEARFEEGSRLIHDTVYGNTVCETVCDIEYQAPRLLALHERLKAVARGQR